MLGSKRTLCAACALLLAGCEAKVGNSAGNAADENGQVSAEGKAEEGKVTVKAPGLELSLAIPMEITGKADHQGRLLHPDAAVSGVYVAGGEGGEGEVELRFHADAPPETVAAWYRDPARADDFTLSSFGREGDAFVAAGEEKKDGQRFRLRLGPGEAGGTDGRLAIRDRG